MKDARFLGARHPVRGRSARIARVFCVWLVAAAVGPMAQTQPPEGEVAKWMEGLASNRTETRLAAVTQLGRLGKGARPAWQGLVVAAADADPTVRLIAVEALEDASLPKELSMLRPLTARLEALGAARKPHERAEAIRRLGQSGGMAHHATSVVERELAAEPVVRASAIIALGEIGPGASAALPRLAKILEGPGGDESLEAAVSISRIAVTGLLARQGPPERVDLLQKTAARLSRELGKDQALFGARQFEVLRALSRLGPVARDSIPTLKSLLESRTRKRSIGRPEPSPAFRPSRARS